MNILRLTGAARNDIKAILRFSEREFGETTRTRYKALLDRALLDLAEDPGRAGVKEASDLRVGHFLYHLRHVKIQIDGAAIRRPRHFITFRFGVKDEIIVLRILHDQMMLRRHL